MNLRRAGARAASAVQRAVRLGDLRRLLTFTNGQTGGCGWSTGQEAVADFRGWLAAGGGRLLPDGGLVVVAEPGTEGGRWHIHVACKHTGWIDYSTVIRSWSEYMEGCGWHSATGTHRFHAGDERGKHRGGFRSARHAGRYMAKYLSKGFKNGHNRDKHSKRYRVLGLTIKPPQRVYMATTGAGREAITDTFGHGSWQEFYSPAGDVTGWWFDIPATARSA